MNIRVSKWGDGLALRIPDAFIKEIQLKDGDIVEVTLSIDGALVIRPPRLDRKSMAKMAREFRATLKMGTSVMDELRSEARY